MMADKEKLQIQPKSGYGLYGYMISEIQKGTHNAQNYFQETMTNSEDDGRIRKIHTPT